MSVQTNIVLNEIRNERHAQDAQWGGPTHDDQHDAEMWTALITDRVRSGYAEKIVRNDNDMYRRRLVQTAALCVAAVEALDRQRK